MFGYVCFIYVRYVKCFALIIMQGRLGPKQHIQNILCCVPWNKEMCTKLYIYVYVIFMNIFINNGVSGFFSIIF